MLLFNPWLGKTGFVMVYQYFVSYLKPKHNLDCRNNSIFFYKGILHKHFFENNNYFSYYYSITGEGVGFIYYLTDLVSLISPSEPMSITPATSLCVVIVNYKRHKEK